MCDTCEARFPTRQSRGYNTQYDRNRLLMIEQAIAQNAPCYKCGKRFTARDQITADHVLPLRLGGTSELFNLAPCCKKCNYGHR